MKTDGKTIYAQSSDIKSRTYLEYRRDMKKKAIAELETLEWLENKVKELNPSANHVKVYKSGGDKTLWFLRKGGVSRKGDFIAEIDDKKIELEFQYAEKTDLQFYDFKVSKVAKKKRGQRVPIENKFFIYIHKPSLRYAIFPAKWIVENGEYGMVPAWRSYAFRVPKETFEEILEPDTGLEELWKKIDAKVFVLNFQHKLIDINKEKLSHTLQAVIDDNKIVEIMPKDLDSFFKICFILDNVNKVPNNANLWLVYLLTYVDNRATLEEISKIVYSIDFLYSKIELKDNELSQVIEKIKILLEMVKAFYKDDGSYQSSPSATPVDETRYALFSINLLEDLIQDIIYYYPSEATVDLSPIIKIYENVEDIQKTYGFLKSAN